VDHSRLIKVAVCLAGLRTAERFALVDAHHRRSCTQSIHSWIHPHLERQGAGNLECDAIVEQVSATASPCAHDYQGMGSRWIVKDLFSGV